MLTPLLRTASQFVDRLAPSDYAAFIGFPEPGPRVDFTTDKAAVRKAMQAHHIGQPAKVSAERFQYLVVRGVRHYREQREHSEQERQTGSRRLDRS